MEKADVRRQALDIRNGLECDYRARCSERIMEQVFQSEWFEKAKIVLSYASIRSEVETDALNRDVLRRGKQLYLPKTDARINQMRFFWVEYLTELRTGYQGILEPPETVSAETLFEKDSGYTKEDVLMIMPGVAFDGRGFRMGYGGGYYDRYLEKYGENLTCVLVAFDEQKQPVVPAETWDMKPAYIVTQSTVWRTGQSRKA